MTVAIFLNPNEKPYTEIGTGIENVFHLIRMDAIGQV